MIKLRSRKKSSLVSERLQLQISLIIFVIICAASLITSIESKESESFDDHEYSHDIGIKLKKDFADDLVSDLFATSYGLEKVAKILDWDHDQSIFHFKLPAFSEQSSQDGDASPSSSRHHRVRRHIENKIDLLRQDNRVEFVWPQVFLSRHKREQDRRHRHASSGDALTEEELAEWLLRFDETNFPSRQAKVRPDAILKKRKKILSNSLEQRNGSKKTSSAKDDNGLKFKVPNQINFNDVEYPKQWYLINEGQFKTPPLHDLNVMNAWMSGYTGKNVTIVVVDDGLDYEHEDFKDKYRPDLSYDFNDENDTNHDPMPSTFDDQNNHGTRCAGAAVAKANNSACGVGIAFDAEIGGIRILDGPITDLLEARALSYKASKVHIRSASWGPRDDGSRMEYPGPLVNLALESGVKHGRNGKGTLYVWATGNGGSNGDDCSCDGYVSHWDIISIGSVNHRGLSPYFMELCPSTMAVVYSGGQTNIDDDDADDPGVRVVASDVRGKCTTTFQGTSSAAPLAAGAFALVLEANPELTYRDVMYLIAKTSRIPNIEDKSGWIINGAGYHVNEKYGFGVMDVAQMLQEAQGWQNVPQRQTCEVTYNDELPEIKAGDLVEIVLEVTGCTNIDVLEHVVANISFTYSRRGDLKLTLVSPHKTPSELLSYRPNDRSDKGARHFPFMTLFKWGESPRGNWKLRIETRPDLSTDKAAGEKSHGRLGHFSLRFFGTAATTTTDAAPATSSRKRYARMDKRAYEPSDAEIDDRYERELKRSRSTRIVSKRLIDENPVLRDILKNLDQHEEKLDDVDVDALLN